jgi:hypothetical protein
MTYPKDAESTLLLFGLVGLIADGHLLIAFFS